MSNTQALAILLEDELVTFTRAVGLLRRRNLPVRSIAVGPASAPGLSRLTVMMQTDEATADRAAKYLEKVVGVHEAVTFAAAEASTRELALIKVQAPPNRVAELLDVAQLYHCTVVDDSPDAVVLEVSGSEAFVGSCLRALDRFKVLEVARTGAVAVTTL